ncbi:hypothetical protein GLOIN_2v1655488 [Rhizophagus clarus]|uniref:Uncharacterized protein n=1 Tax=Rhizophagus clarus TaxID=94130 RepID=A0A8H3LR62_9GLOM|nr:hypothetical protein GLOIN_2v1655488 [Rhizophagus clarus]
MPEGLDLTFSKLPDKYKERILERRRTHGTRRTTFRDFKIVLPPRPAEQPRTPEQILQRPENVFDNNFSTNKSVSSKRKSVHDDDEEYEQLETPTSRMKNNDRSRSSQMSLGSPMEIDYSIDVGNIEVLVSKTKYNDDDERSDIVMMDEENVLDKFDKSPGEKLDTTLDEVDIPEKSSEEQLDVVMYEGNEGDEDEREVDVQAKSSEEQIDIVTDEVQITEEIESSQNRRRSLRRKSKNGCDIVKDKDKISAKPPKEQIDTITIEKDEGAKSSEEQMAENIEITEKAREIKISKGKNKPTRRNITARRGAVKNKGKSSAKSPEQIDTVMEDVVPDKFPEEQEEPITEATEINQETSEVSKSKKKPTRRKNKVERDLVKNKGKTSTKTQEQLDTVMDEIVPDKLPEEQIIEISEEANEVNQSRKRRTRRMNEIERDVKNKGKISSKSSEKTKSSEQRGTVMDDVVPSKEQEEHITEVNEEVREISQSRKRPTRRKNKVGSGTIKNKGKATVKSPEKLDTVMDEDIPEEDIPAISSEDQDVAEESMNQHSDEAETFEEQAIEEREISQGRRKKSSRLKIKCHKVGSGTIQDKDGNIVKKTSAAKLNEFDIIGDVINETITEFLNENNSFKKEIQCFKNEIESHLLEQSDLLDEQIMLRSSLKKSKTRMNCLRQEMLDVQRERDKVRKELTNERRTFANEEQERKKLEQAHNFLTDLETLREAVDAEGNMQEDQEDEEILDGFKGLLVSVTSRKGRFDALCRFNMLLEMCEKMIRQATDT